jgi:hypothetical protein
MAYTLGDAALLAARLVAEHWPAIVRIAEALLDRDELSGVELARAFRGIA